MNARRKQWLREQQYEQQLFTQVVECNPPKIGRRVFRVYQHQGEDGWGQVSGELNRKKRAHRMMRELKHANKFRRFKVVPHVIHKGDVEEYLEEHAEVVKYLNSQKYPQAN